MLRFTLAAVLAALLGGCVIAPDTPRFHPEHYRPGPWDRPHFYR